MPHYLLASLPVTEAATTNYDTLFETAWRAATDGGEDEIAILPRNNATYAHRWLLKLHGDMDDASRTLVLSRDQYLRLEQISGAIAAVVQAMLLTRHILVIGYSLNDETFHRIAFEVRQITASPDAKTLALSSRDQPSHKLLGTAILVEPPGLIRDVWQVTSTCSARAGGN